MMHLTCHICVFLFFFFAVSCSVTWEMAQTMTSLTGKIVDKTGLCLANQPANMSDDPVYSLHTTACRTAIKLSKLFGSTIENQYLYIQNPVHYHANWTKEKRHAQNTMPLSFHFSSHIGFVIKYTVYTLKNSRYQNITIDSKATQDWASNTLASSWILFIVISNIIHSY